MDPICKKCGNEYSLRDGCEPTTFCDKCAHEVAEVAAKFSTLYRTDPVSDDLDLGNSIYAAMAEVVRIAETK